MKNIVKNTTFFNPLDLLAPHSCRGCGAIGKPLCDCCKKNILNNALNYCPNCKLQKSTGKCSNALCKNLPPTYVVAERSSLLGQLIHDYKYASRRALALPIAKIIDETIPKTFKKVIIVPLPTIPKHIRERGFDHTYLIAKHFAKLRGKDYRAEKILVRAKNTVQVGADEKTRIVQANNAYTLRNNTKLDPKTTYILFDDVWTTGASLKSALKKLRDAGASRIIILALTVNRLN